MTVKCLVGNHSTLPVIARLLTLSYSDLEWERELAPCSDGENSRTAKRGAKIKNLNMGESGEVSPSYLGHADGLTSNQADERPPTTSESAGTLPKPRDAAAWRSGPRPERRRADGYKRNHKPSQPPRHPTATGQKTTTHKNHKPRRSRGSQLYKTVILSP